MRVLYVNYKYLTLNTSLCCKNI